MSNFVENFLKGWDFSCGILGSLIGFFTPFLILIVVVFIPMAIIITILNHKDGVKGDWL